MTTFQAIIYGIVHGFTEFLPLSPSAHHPIISFLTGWPAPEGGFAGALNLGAFFAIMVFFRHDWASIISCFIQVIIFRKKPMTLDERMPIFLFATSLPTFVGWYYLHEPIAAMNWNPLWIAGTLAIFSLPMWLTESTSRRNKGMFDWNILDALLVGITQLMMLVPGSGQLAASLTGAFFRNFNREAAAKYAFLAMAPVLAATSCAQLREVHLHSASPVEGVSWLTFNTAWIIALLAGLLAIGGFMRHVQRSRLGAYVAYRSVVAAVVAALYWWKNRA